MFTDLIQDIKTGELYDCSLQCQYSCW